MFARILAFPAALSFLLPITAVAHMGTPQFSLSVEPAVVHVSVMPGARYEGVLNVRNQGAGSLRLSARAYDFVPVDDAGGVKLVESSENQGESDPLAAAGWVKFPSGNIVSGPGKTLRIPYVLTVPDDASPGARSLALVLDAKESSVGTRFESLVFLEVPGDAKTSMEISDFSQNSLFNSDSSGIFHLRIKNNGKTHLHPDGELVIRNMFGTERARFGLVGANSLGTIPPGSTRSIDYEYQGVHGVVDFGLWNARVSLTQGEMSIADRTFFLVLPWRSIAICLGALCGSLFLMRYSLMRMRREIKGGGEEGEPSIVSLCLVVLAGIIVFGTISYILFDFLSVSHEGALQKITQFRS